MKKILFIIISIIIIIYFFISKNYLLDETTFTIEDEVKIYFNGIHDIEKSNIIKNDNIYISAKYLNENNILDSFWDNKEKIITIFNEYKVDKLIYDNEYIYLNNVLISSDVIIFDKEKLFFSIDFLINRYKKIIAFDEKTNSVFIEEITNKYIISNNTKLRKKPSYFCKTIKNLKRGDEILVYEGVDKNWLLVRTNDYVIGYLNKDVITAYSKELKYEYWKNKEDKNIVLAWDFFSKKLKDFKETDIPYALNVIAPTWHQLIDDEKHFTDFSNKEYIQFYKSHNVKTWVTFNNSFDIDLTSKVLNSSKMRYEVINKIINIVNKNGYDGINIDFENIYYKDRDVYSTFIKELYCSSKEKDITLSVDVTVLSGSETWSKCFDRKVIGKYSDFVILMAYDENVGGENIGSVSSIPWVKRGVENLLENVNSEKTILGIPFYTRLWSIRENNNNYEIGSSALKLDTAKKRIDEFEIELKYDSKTGQNYGEKEIDDIKYSIWNEDSISLINRLSIVREYSLNGVAIWCLDYGVPEMWDTIYKQKNDLKKY